MAPPKILISEYRDRLRRVRRELAKRRLDALYVTDATSFHYLTGFSYIQTERPAAIVIPMEGAVKFLGPVIERAHIPLETSLIEEFYTFLDYPGTTHPMKQFASWLKKMRLGRAKIGTDNPKGASGAYGYQGPALGELIKPAKFKDASDIIPNMRLIKSEGEISMLKESSRWCDRAHEILLEATDPGRWDVEVALEASMKATLEMREEYGPTYNQSKVSLSPVVVGYRGQVGPNSAIPHSIGTARTIKKGDVLVTEAGVDIGGYISELERTVFVGRPSSRQSKFFEAMKEAQEAGFKALRLGNKCSDVDRATRRVIEDSGLGKYLLHHTGHGIGLEGHEPPWLDIGDQTKIRSGMVFSCEPGLYVPGFGGFRHSDTIAITQRGSELLTKTKRDVESMTIT